MNEPVSLYYYIPHRELLYRQFPQGIGGFFSEEAEIGHIFPPNPPAGGELGPQQGGQADHRQVERPKDQGLDGVAVLMDQHPPGNFPVGDQASPVSGGLVREEDKHPQGEAVRTGPGGDHSPVAAEAGTAPRIAPSFTGDLPSCNT